MYHQRVKHLFLELERVFLLPIFTKKILSAVLVFFWCPPNCDVTFKIINRLKVNNDNFKFNSILKVDHITVGKTPKEYYKNI